MPVSEGPYLTATELERRWKEWGESRTPAQRQGLALLHALHGNKEALLALMQVEPAEGSLWKEIITPIADRLVAVMRRVSSEKASRDPGET